MNILPKKSWHVRTKKNIERVRRDEEKAAEEEKEQQRRIALAEQEARTELLRGRSKKRLHDQLEDSESSLAIESTSSPTPNKLVKVSKDISIDQGGHVNFFKDIEEGLHREGKNKEHEAEKAAEKEKWEKNIGLLTYLGQSSIETQNDVPWYLQKKKEKEQSQGKPSSTYEPKKMERVDRDEKLKNSMDPLKDMKKHLDRHYKHKHKDSKLKEKPRHSKHKPDSNKSSKSGKPSTSCPSSAAPSASGSEGKSKTIEQLRAERLRRETAEKQKIAAVMAKARGEVAEVREAVSDVERDRTRGYNSRYNPNFVRPQVHYRR